jgi:hypothetical protein
MREYLIRHLRQLDLWTSVTIDPQSTSALLVRGPDVNSIETVSYQTARTILDYCEQSGDFLVTTV